jgi:hypothetical protein
MAGSYTTRARSVKTILGFLFNRLIRPRRHPLRLFLTPLAPPTPLAPLPPPLAIIKTTVASFAPPRIFSAP